MELPATCPGTATRHRLCLKSQSLEKKKKRQKKFLNFRCLVLCHKVEQYPRVEFIVLYPYFLDKGVDMLLSFIKCMSELDES